MQMKCGYLAGIAESNAAASLCFSVSGKATGNERLAASWSWASIPGARARYPDGLTLDFDFSESYRCQVLADWTNPEMQNSRSTSGARITIRGIVGSISSAYLLAASKESSCYFYEDLNWWAGVTGSILLDPGLVLHSTEFRWVLMVEGRYSWNEKKSTLWALLLAPVDGSEDTYQRIGLIEAESETSLVAAGNMAAVVIV